MNFKKLLHLFLGRRHKTAPFQKPRPHGFRPILEALEDRLAPATFTVMNANDAGPGSLRQAILAANATAAMDTIVFSAALNNQTITLTSGDLAITRSLAIVGLGSNRLNLDGNNASRIFQIDDSSSNSIRVFMSGLTLTHGKADDGDAGATTNADRGGAIFNTELLTIANCVIVENFAAVEGGGIFNLGDSLILRNSTVADNTAVSNGGALLNLGQTVTVTDSTFSGNSAGIEGGGILNFETLTVTNSTFSGNSGQFGGGISNIDTLSVTNSVFSGNAASKFGGGIINGGALTVSNSTFSGNSGQFGGGINNAGGTATVSNSTLSGNTATGDGGGIHNDATLTVSGATLSENSAASLGGGIYNAGGRALVVTDSTLEANSANDAGGGISNNGTASVTSSVFSGNAANDGGGIYNSGTGTVAASTFGANSAELAGGGIYNASTLTVTNSTLRANSAPLGGGIRNVGTLTVTDSTLSANSGSLGGGGIHNGGTVTVTNAIISGNSSTSDAGGIYNSGTLTLNNSTLAGNTATSDGGGIANDGTLTLTSSTISGNAAVGNGGGIYSGGTLTLIDSTLAANSASSDGGGIANDGELLLTNSTLSGNTSPTRGGAIYNVNGVVATNSTIVANRANLDGVGAETGGGIFTFAGATTRLFNTIVAGNLRGAAAGAPDDLSGPEQVSLSSVNNLIGDPASAGGVVNANNGNIVGKNAGADLLPLSEILDPVLRNNGGPTETHALVFGSPAIDAGDDAFVPADTPFDQRGPGFARIIGGDVDIGAFEMPNALFTDDFDRADSATLGLNWIKRLGVIGVNGDAAQGAGATTPNIATVNGLSLADVDLYASGDLDVNQQAGFLARYVGPGDRNYYLASLSVDALGDLTARIVKNVNGVVTELAVVEEVTPALVFRFRVVGTSLQFFAGATLLASVEDSTFKSGAVGIRTIGSATVDDVAVFPVTTGIARHDDFAQPDNTLLADAWTNAIGFYRTVGEKIQGGQPLNLAYLNAANQADVDVSANVSVTGLKHSAGLLARYRGAGDRNYYLAKLTRTSAGFAAQIIRNLNGLNKTLATVNIVSSTGNAALRFVATGNNLRLFVNNALVADVLDSSLVSGSVGIRSDMYAKLDDFHVHAVAAALPFADGFAQPDGASLSDNWTRRAGGFKVIGESATGTAVVNSATLVGVSAHSVEVRGNVSLAKTGDQAGLLAAYTSEMNYYLANVVKTASGFMLSIVRRVNGVVTTLKSRNVTALTGAITLRVEGTSLKLFMNDGIEDVEQLSVLDAALPTGSVGMRTVRTGAIDNFSATEVAFLPFADDFSAPTLNANFITRVGGYVTTDLAAPEQAIGLGNLNLATLGRVNVADVDIQATIDVLSFVGEHASLVARHAGGGDNTMYLASITFTSAGYVASIAKKINGVTTILATVAAGPGAGPHNLRFTAIGGKLTLYFDGAELLSVFDFSLKSGSVGIRSSFDTIFDDLLVARGS